MQNWVSFDTLLREIILELEYETLSPLRIGSGTAKLPTSPVDLQVATIFQNGIHKPYIPGSSLKGVLRSICENLASSLKISDCFMGEKCKRNFDERLKSSIELNLIDEAKKLLSNYCIICKTFGTASYKSHIYVSDAYAIREVSRGVKVGIAIDRRSGIAQRGAFYSVEYVDPGFTFSGTIAFKNTPNYLMGMVMNALDLINMGYKRIGGFKTRGFGRMQVKIKDFKGVELKGDTYMNIKELNELPGLDDYDSSVKLTSINEFLNSCKESWNNYVKKIHTSES
ncbi:MAG: CRISPR-associated RAMP protein Csx7 [Candidatus Bathyarchaeia archaeon]|nr:CRISPR-associated RAMP protein [Candidatus Bathyarchaeota archaeon]